MDKKSNEQFIIMQAAIESKKGWNPTRMTLMIKWLIPMNTSKQWTNQLSHKWWIRLTFQNPRQTMGIHQSLCILLLWYLLPGGLLHWKVETLQKISGMWTLKNDISSPNFYELLTKTELKVDTDMEIKHFYNHINMCLNAVTILWEDLIYAYQYIKRHSEFGEYFIPDSDNLLIIKIYRYTLPFDTNC